MQLGLTNRHYVLLFFSILLVCLTPTAILGYNYVRAALGGSDATPVAYWSFDEGVDGTCPSGEDACDASGNANDLTNTNAVWQNDQYCIAGKCLAFNGSDTILSYAGGGGGGGTLTRESYNTYQSSTNYGTGSYTTSSFTPQDNSLLVVAAGALEDNCTSDVSSCMTISDSEGLTWTERVDANNTSSWAIGTTTWTAPVSTGTSMTLTFDCGAQNIYGYMASVANYTGYNTSTPTDGTASSNSGGTNGAASITLSSAPETTSEVFAFAYFDSNNGTQQVAEGTGWTELADAAASSQHLHAQVRNGSTSTSVSWNDLHSNGSGSNVWKSILTAVEIQQDAGGGGGGSSIFTSSSSFTVGGWFKSPPNSATQYLISEYDTAGFKAYMNSDGTITCAIDDDSTWSPDATTSSTGTYDDNSWHHFACVKNGTSSLTLYINGLQVAQNSSISGITTTDGSGTTYIGSDSDGTSNIWNGFLDEVKVFDSVLSANQIKAEHAGGAAILGTQDTNFLTQGLVGYWNMDEGSGASISDQSGNNTTGTLTNNPSFAAGKFGSAIEFTDESSAGEITFDNVSIGEQSSGTTLTFAHETSGTDRGLLVGVTTYNDSPSVATVTATYNGESMTEIETLLFGLFDEERLTVFYLGNPASGSNNVVITASQSGTEIIGAAASFNGVNQNSAIRDSNTDVDDNTSSHSISVNSDTNDLVVDFIGFYGGGTLNSGANQTTHSYNNNGENRESLAVSSKPGESSSTNMSWSTGSGYYSGQIAVSLIPEPGGTPYVNMASTSHSVNTASFWVNPDSNTNNYLSLNNSAYITSTSGTISATGFTNPTIYVNGVQTSSISADSWQHIVITTDSPITLDDNFYLGRQNSNYFDGTLDELRLYNRSLTPAEVKSLYNWAPGPIGYWNFDENTGSTVHDKSGNGNNGTFNGDTTWTTGKFGAGVIFDGTGDYVTISDNNALDLSDSYTLSAWVNLDRNDGQDQYLITKGDSTDNNYYILYCPTTGDNSCASDRFVCGYWNGSTATEAEYTITPTEGQWYHISCTMDDPNDTLQIYVDGVLRDTNSSATIDPSTTTNNGQLRFGRERDSFSYYTQGSLDEVKIYNYPRTQQQIIEDLNAGHPTGGSPVGSQLSYWKFDEMQGDTANDHLGTNNGNLAGTCPGASSCPTWIQGKLNGALSFDGVDEYVAIPNESDYDFGSTQPFTITAWFKVDAFDIGWQTLISKGDTAFRISRNGTNDSLEFGVGSGGNSVIGSINVNDGAWHHVAGVYDGAGTGYLYIDGQLDNSDSVTASTNNETVYIGENSNGPTSTRWWEGQIDEVKIYTSALTQDQVLIDLNANSALSFGTGTDLADNFATSFGDPPVGYWDFNDNTGTTTIDKSGNGNDGTLVHNSTWGVGKYGSAVSMDGATSADGDTHIRLPNDIYNNDDEGTICAWINPSSVSGNDVIFGATESDAGGIEGLFVVFLENGEFTIQIINDGDSSLSPLGLDSNYSVPTNEWTHTCFSVEAGVGNKVFINGSRLNNSSFTYGAGNSSTDAWISNFTPTTVAYTIGCVDANASDTNDCQISGGGGNFDGLIDEVKYWDYPLSPTQIVYEYNQGDPMYWYKLDENMGTTAYNNAKNANGEAGGTDGTLVNNATWATGKYNTAIDFDGDSTNNGSSISFANDSFSFLNEGTIALWFNPDDTGDSFQNLFSAGETSGGDYYEIGFSPGDNRVEIVTSGCSSTNINGYTTLTGTISTWHHLAYTVNSSGHTLYINGQPQALTYSSGNSNSTCFYDDVSFGTATFRAGCNRIQRHRLSQRRNV